jgi:hypothetical protein
MLADSTEAVVRSSPDHGFEKIDELVEGVIAERLAEGQFDDCDLTLRDLRTIADSFKITLRAIYHPRIEYPAPTEAERQRTARRVALAPEPAELVPAASNGHLPEPIAEPATQQPVHDSATVEPEDAETPNPIPMP